MIHFQIVLLSLCLITIPDEISSSSPDVSLFQSSVQAADGVPCLIFARRDL